MQVVPPFQLIPPPVFYTSSSEFLDIMKEMLTLCPHSLLRYDTGRSQRHRQRDNREQHRVEEVYVEV
jgi:hypothetical protein